MRNVLAFGSDSFAEQEACKDVLTEISHRENVLIESRYYFQFCKWCMLNLMVLSRGMSGVVYVCLRVDKATAPFKFIIR